MTGFDFRHAPTMGVSVIATLLMTPSPAAVKSLTSEADVSSVPGDVRWSMVVTLGSCAPSAPTPPSGH